MSLRCSFRSSAVMSGIGPAPPRSTRNDRECLSSLASAPDASKGDFHTLGCGSMPPHPTVLGMPGDAGTHAPSTAARAAGALSGAVKGRWSAVAQERRDVDLVVGDLERGALDPRAAVAAAGAVARLLARGARAGAAVVE